MHRRRCSSRSASAASRWAYLLLTTLLLLLGQAALPAAATSSSPLAVSPPTAETANATTTLPRTSSTAAASSDTSSGSVTSRTEAAPPSAVVTEDPLATCQSRTVNYITHTLPQQCLRSSRTSGARTESGEAQASDAGRGAEKDAGTTETAQTGTEQASSSTATATQTAQHQDADADSPLDNSKFLSFEEWKKQNLEKAGQSPEHVGKGRGAAPPGGRRRPETGSLDSLGDEGEIDFNFGVFDGGARDEASGVAAAPAGSSAGGGGAGEDDSARDAASRYPRGKDAGITCKERNNYASFDCAATILKTNPRCKSATSVLVENKDSYMLNECAERNKFLIVELCTDIVVDTVVLANYEFFSSMVRTFRVSVSDRYPPLPDQWVDLGVFEARNSREIQAFLVEGPRVWAKYLRVEFLTHYGNEYYCPVSLLRVHGITMMEEYKHEERAGREAAAAVVVASEERLVTEGVAEPTVVVTAETLVAKEVEATSMSSFERTNSDNEVSSSIKSTAPTGTESESASLKPTGSDSNDSRSAGSGVSTSAAGPTSDDAQRSPAIGPLPRSVPEVIGTKSQASVAESGTGQSSKLSQSSIPENKTAVVQDAASTPISSPGTVDSSRALSSTDNTPVNGSSTAVSTNSSATVNSTTSTAASTNNTSANQVAHTKSKPASIAAPASIQPAAPSPSTQESFFKSINKRLQALESNASLSLQYIESQSRILRDAFGKVEKRQLDKSSAFLEQLNATVLAELRTFRTQYDQLWQSTVIELETHRDLYQREIRAVSSRLGLLADEVVFQKRVSVVQSTLLLMCLGFVLFARPGTAGSGVEFPVVQAVMGKSGGSRSGLASARSFDSSGPASPEPSSSPDSARRRTRRRSGLSRFFKASPGRRPVVEISAPTPSDGSPETYTRTTARHIGGAPTSQLTRSPSVSSASSVEPDSPRRDTRRHKPLPPVPNSPTDSGTGDSAAGSVTGRPHPRRIRSGPATPQGTRDNPLDWEPPADGPAIAQHGLHEGAGVDGDDDPVRSEDGVLYQLGGTNGDIAASPALSETTLTGLDPVDDD